MTVFPPFQPPKKKAKVEKKEPVKTKKQNGKQEKAAKTEKKAPKGKSELLTHSLKWVFFLICLF